MSRAMELRILTGIHAGAREPLAGEGVIGADAGCDFVLADEGVLPRHARLAVHQDGWQLQWLSDETAAPIDLKPGLAVSLGSVLVTVDHAPAPWPATPQVHELQAVVAANDESAGEAQADPVAQAVVHAAETPPVHATMAAVAAPSGPPRAFWWGGGALLVVAAAVGIAWPLMSAPVAQPVMQPVALARPSPAQRAAIERVLQDMSLMDRTRIDAQGANWIVRATYLDDEEAENLAVALSKITPRPGLRMTSERDLRQDIDEAMIRMGSGIHGVIKSKYLGDARFRIEGMLPTSTERDTVLHTLKTSFPQVRGWENGLLVPEDVAAKLVEELGRAGFYDVSGRWKDGVFDMDVKLLQQQVPRWERALQLALVKYTVPINATLSFDRPTAMQGRLPFQVRSVVGGETPYVILGDGSKLMVEGTRAGWKLASVDAAQVVFQHGEQRAVLAR